MIHYFVRTTNSRKVDYKPLHYSKLIDFAHKPVQSFIRQLRFISKYDAVLLEDDLILCKDFQAEIEKVISQYPNSIINFYTQPRHYFTTKTETVFKYNQCTYYPKGIGEIIANKMEELLPQFGPKQRLWSQVENLALKQLNITHICYRPCLVQHPDKESILKSHDPNRIDYSTIWFKDYLDELAIDYSVANTEENISKLRDYRYKHINK